MGEKAMTNDKDSPNLDLPFVPEEYQSQKHKETAARKVGQRTKCPRTVKLPRLKLADLVSQITEKNAHSEISTGQAVGNEVW